MKKTITFLALNVFLTFISSIYAQVNSNYTTAGGYYRSNGFAVKQYERTMPNNFICNYYQETLRSNDFSKTADSNFRYPSSTLTPTTYNLNTDYFKSSNYWNR